MSGELEHPSIPRTVQGKSKLNLFQRHNRWWLGCPRWRVELSERFYPYESRKKSRLKTLMIATIPVVGWFILIGDLLLYVKLKMENNRKKPIEQRPIKRFLLGDDP